MLVPASLLAYVGPVPGPEFLGYFTTLVVWVMVASSAVLTWPFYALMRYLRGGPRTPPQQNTPPAN